MSVYPVERGEGALPVFRQIAEVLRKEIQELYKAGDALPAETRLAERFAVNRHTLRRAIEELINDGLVERYHGKGVFVLEPAIRYSIGKQTRFTETLEAQGKKASSQVLKKQIVPAAGGVASRLQVAEGCDVLFIETLRHVDDQPFCISSHFMPVGQVPGVFEHYEQGSLHQFLATHCGIKLVRSESLISAVLAEGDDASLLNMPRQAPVLRVKSVNLHAQSGLPIEYTVTRFRGDATQLSIQP